MEVISINSIKKNYKQFVAVDGISLEINEGEIYGFLGLNGAGKTTTIRMMLGMIKPTDGAVSLFGQNVNSKFNKWNEVGYLVETPHSYPNLTVEENLEVYFCYRKLHDRNLIHEIIDKLHLEKYIHARAEHLSLGNQQRLGLAKALMHKPKLLILDEPINGLDPAGIVEIRALLKQMATNGTTIFLSSHILGEIAKVASRIGIIHEGKLVKELFTNELESHVIRKLLIDTDNNEKTIALLKERGYQVAINEHLVPEINTVSAVNKPEDISSLLAESNILLKQLFVDKEDLESFFLRTIRKKSTHE